MKRMIAAILVVIIALLPICSYAVTQEEYNKVVSERNALYQQLIEAGFEPVVDLSQRAENPVPEKGYDGSYSEFLSSDTVTAAHKEGDYFVIAELLHNYLSTPKSSLDSAHELKPYFENMLDIKERTYWDIDIFDGTKTLRWTECSSITEAICIAPYLSGTDLYCRFGFVKEDWVFFDTFAISLNGEIIFSETVDSSDKVTDVLKGSTITEWCDIDLRFQEIESNIIESIRNEGTLVIRFSNSKDEKKFDHIFSAEEATTLADYFEFSNAYEKYEDINRYYGYGVGNISRTISKKENQPVYPLGIDTSVFARFVGTNYMSTYKALADPKNKHNIGETMFEEINIMEIHDGYCFCGYDNWILLYSDGTDFSSLDTSSYNGASVFATLTYLGPSAQGTPIFYLGRPTDSEKAAIDLTAIKYVPEK